MKKESFCRHLPNQSNDDTKKWRQSDDDTTNVVEMESNWNKRLDDHQCNSEQWVFLHTVRNSLSRSSLFITVHYFHWRIRKPIFQVCFEQEDWLFVLLPLWLFKIEDPPFSTGGGYWFHGGRIYTISLSFAEGISQSEKLSYFWLNYNYI